MDRESLEHCVWFPGEEICKTVPSPDWVKRQRKLAKKLTFDSGCFTVRMLERKCIVTAGTKGVDPGKGHPLDLEEKWLEKHQEYERSAPAVAIQDQKNTPIYPGKAAKKGAPVGAR
jgi:hypothetical protein